MYALKKEYAVCFDVVPDLDAILLDALEKPDGVALPLCWLPKSTW